MEMTGLLGQTSTVSAARMASITPGAATAASAPSKRTARTGGSHRSRTNHSCIASSPGGHGDAGGDAAVGHGHQAGAEAPGGGDLGGDLAQSRALPQPPGAEEVGGEVAVAEPEPGVLAVAGEGVDGGERLARQAPPGVGVLGSGEGVGDRVEVGADVEAVEPVVVGGVDDHGDVGGVDDLHQPAEEARRPHPARQRRDHAVSVPGRVRDAGSVPPCGKGPTVRWRP